jgi:two-component system NarL family response regulator
VKPTLKKSVFLLSKMEKIKVILSHPQVIFREGIHFVLSGEEDFEVAGEATGNREALELIEAKQADVAILSQKDDKVSAAETTRRIKRTYPSVAVVLITDKNADEPLFPAIISGISAYLSPDIEPEGMVEAIKEAAQGHFPVVEALLKPEVAARTLADFKDLATLNEGMGVAMAQLSQKETEILNCIVSGSDIGQAAAKLTLTQEGVRIHLRDILKKLVANDHVRSVIAGSQRTLPSLIPGGLKGRARSAEYLTRAEFNEFKDSLMAGFKSLVGGKL